MTPEPMGEYWVVVRKLRRWLKNSMKKGAKGSLTWMICSFVPMFTTQGSAFLTARTSGVSRAADGGGKAGMSVSWAKFGRKVQKIIDNIMIVKNL